MPFPGFVCPVWYYHSENRDSCYCRFRVSDLHIHTKDKNTSENIWGWKKIQSQQVRLNRNPSGLKKNKTMEKHHIQRKKWQKKSENQDDKQMTWVIWSSKTECRVFLFAYCWIHCGVWYGSVKCSQSSKMAAETSATEDVFLGIYDYKPQDQHVTFAVLKILQKHCCCVFLADIHFNSTLIFARRECLITFSPLKNVRRPQTWTVFNRQ